MEIRGAILSVLVVFAIFLSNVRSCGVTQHNYIAHKGLTWLNGNQDAKAITFANIIQQNQDAFQNGAAFPDWGYDCANEGNASEDAHWPPFTVAYSYYFYKNCGNNPTLWNSHCKKLVAFLFGIVSHQTADVLWHDLVAANPTYQGFIQSMANVDFNGVFSSAHTVADTGGEFIIAREYDLSFLVDKWYLPVDDLVNIYAELNVTVDSETIRKCNTILYAEVHAVKRAGELLYPYAADKSPFLVDQIQNFWIGGIDDNAGWTYWCWTQYLMNWLTPTKSPPQDYYEICIAQAPVKHPLSHSNYRKAAPILQTLRDEFMQQSVFSDNSNEFGASVISMTSVTDESQIINQESSEEQERVKDQCTVEWNPYVVEGNITNFSTYVGWSLSSGDLNNDGADDLIIGAPGFTSPGTPENGGVFIVYGASSLSPNSPNVTVTTPLLVGQSAHERFGWASTVVDFNVDGYLDIVVSSPTIGADLLRYYGRVGVFLGSANGKYSTVPDIEITTSVNYTNLGNNLLSYDFNGDGNKDLIITAPFAGNGTAEPQQYGRVFMIPSSTSFKAGMSLDVEQTSSWILRGDLPNEWFGQHVEFTTINDTKIVLVGASGFRDSSSTSEQGKIYAYNLTSHARIFTIVGTQLWDQTGFSFAVGKFGSYSSVLALSAPGRKTGIDQIDYGAVYLVDISSLFGAYTVDSVKPITTLQGDEKYARFGWISAFSPDGSTFWVTQPRKSGKKTSPEAGAIYSWSTATIPSKSNNPVDSSDACYASTAERSRFGESLIFADVNGNGVADIIVGAPRWNSQLSGAVSILLQ